MVFAFSIDINVACVGYIIFGEISYVTFRFNHGPRTVWVQLGPRTVWVPLDLRLLARWRPAIICCVITRFVATEVFTEGFVNSHLTEARYKFAYELFGHSGTTYRISCFKRPCALTERTGGTLG